MQLHEIVWIYPPRVITIALIAAGLLYALTGLPWGSFAVIGAGLLLLGLVIWLLRTIYMIDERILALMPQARGWSVHTKSFPAYKLVDIVGAAHWLATQHPRSVTITSNNSEMLALLLSRRQGGYDRRIHPPTMIARPGGPNEEIFVPDDSFWLIRPTTPGELSPCIVRVRFFASAFRLIVEVAAPNTANAERVMEMLLKRAGAVSIYRGHLLRLSFGHETRSSYAAEDAEGPMDIVFLHQPPVTEESIVLDETVRRLLERTVVDFHQRRAALMQFGVPGKRSLLFYGPPGTGKTYTCRYLAHRLSGVTTIVATGHALLRMKDICALAAVLQPALVVLEDVDLVFASRELNPYNTVLGEFMDQLDGFGEQHHVIFLLTTNVIERVETAIKDRPGRVSQCVYFGPPGSTLRLHYLQRALRPYPHSLDLARVVAQTEGASQAFLKELVYRSVQVATANHPPDDGGYSITSAHIEEALEEMLAGAGAAGRRIIGFRIEA